MSEHYAKRSCTNPDCDYEDYYRMQTPKPIISAKDRHNADLAWRERLKLIPAAAIVSSNDSESKCKQCKWPMGTPRQI